MEEKIYLEFTGEQMDKITEYQDAMVKDFPELKDKTVQELLMIAVERQINCPTIII